jgi:23S rRNA pseudouridine955/2504/2580 synthase
MTQQHPPIVDATQLHGAVRLTTIDERHGGQRLDNFLLSQLKGVPKTRIYRMLRTGEVRVNKGRAQADTRLQEGDVVRIPPVRYEAGSALLTSTEISSAFNPELTFRAQQANLPIMFEDDCLLAVNKPEGLAVHGGSGVDFGVIEALRLQRQDRFLELVHRLDRETSGLLLLARKRSALTWCQAQFREKNTFKEYRAVVLGRWPLRSKTLRAPLLKTVNARGERHVYVSEEGKSAVSHVLGLRHGTLANGQGISEVAVRIETGRTHQIRVHLSHAGFPILGDERYGDFARNKAMTGLAASRMFLHARELHLPHPADQTLLKLLAPTPVVFDQLF